MSAPKKIQNVTIKGITYNVFIHGKNDLRIGTYKFKTMKELKEIVANYWLADK